MMKRLIERLWKDDGGALIAMEFLFVATILVLGIIVGLVSVREAIKAEHFRKAIDDAARNYRLGCLAPQSRSSGNNE